ncbi:hypothetical protein DRH14_04750, partial [Candidatus Shapirobacteria bacterium]
MNFSGLVIERSLSLLLGGGVEFDLDDTPEEEYINEVWEANKQSILMHKLGQFGGASGTMYLKIMPDEIDGMPRLMPLDPIWMNITTAPTDIDKVMKYSNIYYLTVDGDAVGYKELVTRQEDDTWLVEQYEKPSSKWVKVASVVWDYDFPPIIHWQNLTNAESPYGISDIEDVVVIQDKINFISSNINKIIRYHAHPKTWGSGFGD